MTGIFLIIAPSLEVCLISNGDRSPLSAQDPSAPPQDLALDSTDLKAYTDTVWLLWSQGREEEAAVIYSRAAEALPERYEPWFEFGMDYCHHIKDDQKAEEMFLKAAECKPHPNPVERQLAHTYEDLGQITDALSLWQDLAECFPEDRTVQLDLNLFRQEHGFRSPLGSCGAPAGFWHKNN